MNKSAPDETKPGPSLEQSRVTGKRQAIIHPSFYSSFPLHIARGCFFFYLKKMAEESFELVQAAFVYNFKNGGGEEGGTLLPLSLLNASPLDLLTVAHNKILPAA